MRTLRTIVLVLAGVLLGATGPALAQTTPDPHAGHQMPEAKPAAAGTNDEGATTPVPPLTDEDRAAAFPPDAQGHSVHDSAVHYFVLFDQLEWQAASGTQGLSWDTKSWIGGDVNRLWLRTEGETDRDELEHAEVHAMYGRAIARWWDLVAGVRQDFRPGSKTWAAVGIQGLAPQWFEVEATAYAGEAGAALRLEAEYELLVTNRLVLQPLTELNLFSKAIPEQQIGAGLSTVEAGLRLRYEVRREFAPYVGAVWQQRFGGTADYARAAGQDIGGWRAAFGVRTWF